MMNHLSRYVAVALVLLPVWATAPTRAADTLVQEWSGVGMMTTRPVTLPGPWELQWNADTDGLFLVTTTNDRGDDTQMIANQFTAGKGSSYGAKPGAYIFKFSTSGKWTARVVLVGH